MTPACGRSLASAKPLSCQNWRSTGQSCSGVWRVTSQRCWPERSMRRSPLDCGAIAVADTPACGLPLASAAADCSAVALTLPPTGG